MLRKIVCICTLVLSLSFAHQSSAADHDNQFWSIVTATGGFEKDSNYRWFLETHPYIGDGMSRLEKMELRGAAGYRVEKNLTLWLGYAWTPGYINAAYQSDYTNENRIFEQATYEHTIFDETKINHRLRFEQRLVQHQPETENRLRYLVRASEPLVKSCENTYGLTEYDEFFLNLNSATPGPEAGYDRNRLFVGPYITDGFVRAELGYLLEYSVRRDKEDRVINAALLNIGFNF